MTVFTLESIFTIEEISAAQKRILDMKLDITVIPGFVISEKFQWYKLIGKSNVDFHDWAVILLAIYFHDTTNEN